MESDLSGGAISPGVVAPGARPAIRVGECGVGLVGRDHPPGCRDAGGDAVVGPAVCCCSEGLRATTADVGRRGVGGESWPRLDSS